MKKPSNQKLHFLLSPRSYLSTTLILLLCVVLAVYNRPLALVGLVLFVGILVFNRGQARKKAKEMVSYIESLTFQVDTATKDTLLNFPMPMTIVDLHGVISWYNVRFGQIFGGMELFDMELGKLVDGLDVRRFFDQSVKSITVYYEGKAYEVFGSLVRIEDQNEEHMLVLYWSDVTDAVELKKKVRAQKMVIAFLNIDNYDEFISAAEDVNKPHILAEIDRRITAWVSSMGGISNKYDTEKYLLVFEYASLEKMIEQKFDILDQVRSITIENRLYVTLSIGVGVGATPSESMKLARASMDLALGRGGDQAVIQDGDKDIYIGGTSQEKDKRVTVKPRVMAHALRQLILHASNILIMGHHMPDMDSFGAAVGLCAAVKCLNKRGFIVMEEANFGVEPQKRKLTALEDYKEVFVGLEQAKELIDESTLLIIVDTHRASYVDFPNLLELVNQVVIIDHHRKSADFISDTVLSYHEPFASSASEMVTEMLPYLLDKFKLNVPEAEALYAGIVMDTKNFVLKTGVRTFEAASYLRRMGVEPQNVKHLLQIDWVTFKSKTSILKEAEKVFDHMAIAVCPSDGENPRVFTAQVADDLLGVTGIEAAFALCKLEGTVVISARSLGDINVQLITEKLGGGGHMTISGAQLNVATIEEAKKLLCEAISAYLEESGQENA